MTWHPDKKKTMDRIEALLDLLDRWDDKILSDRVTPEEFCSEHPELLDEFRQLLNQRGVLTALLNGDNSLELKPEEMIDRMQDGRFPVVQFHDQGGLGWIYLAKDRELGRIVALKCLQPEPATDPEARKRFVREAEITARLEHPGVVPIYGLGGLPQQESPSYAMRFVQGETLRTVIRDFHVSHSKQDWSSLDGIRILRSFVTVCETIAYAHSKNVIHRDLKSSNVMIGAFGETLVLDWGLAKLLTDPEDPSSDLAQRTSGTLKPQLGPLGATLSGATLGTVGFMSPEQARGDWANVKPASDIFSLGAILYQILTNQAPYQGDGALASARDCAHLPPKAIAPSTPKPLAAVCMKAMQADPSQRYNTALELKNDIELYLADEPVSARRESIYERLQRTLRRHRVAVQMGGLMALLTIVMLSAFLSFAAKKNDELKTAYEKEEAAKDKAILQGHRTQEALKASVHENYAANMAQVSQALSDRQPARLADMLIKAGPRIGSPIDPRGIEWWMSWNKAYGGTNPINVNGLDIIGMRLIDGGKKAVAWDSRQRLRILDTRSNATLFATKEDVRIPLNILTEFPSELPCSEDASTIAITDDAKVKIYRWDSTLEEYALSKTIDQGDRVFVCALSHDGRILVTGDGQGHVHWRDLRADQTKSYDVGKGHAITSLQISPTGRYLSDWNFESGSLPTILDLSNGTTIAAPVEWKGVFSRAGFGQYDTLLAWNKEQVVTFAITFPNQLTEIWETELSKLVNNDVMFGPSESIREWITLTDECQSLNESTIRERVHSGNIVNTVRSTTLATMNPQRQMTTERDYRQVGYHLFSREPSKKTSGTSYFDFQSKRPVSISEFRQPNLDSVVDVASDGSTILTRDTNDNYSTISAGSWLWESIDRHDLPGSIQSLGWDKNGQLLSVTQPPNAYSDPFAEFDRCAAPYDQTAKTEHQTLLLIESAKPSEDCSVVADYLENQIRVKTLDGTKNEYKFEYETKSNSFKNDMIMVRVYPWNQRDTKPLPSFVNLAGNEVRRQPLRLPWVLAIPKYETAENNGDAFEPDVSDQKSRFLVVDYEAARVVSELDVPDTAVIAVTISPNGRGIALVSGNVMGFEKSRKTPLLHTWSIDDDQSITKGQVIATDVDARCITMNPGGTHVAIGGLDGQVVVVNLKSGLEVMRANSHEALVRAVTFSPDGSRLASAGEDQTVRFYSTRDWQEVMNVDCQSIPTCLAFDPKSRSLAIGDEAGHIAILSAASRKDVYDLASLWLKQESTAAKGEAAILSELWSEFVTSRGRSEEEMQAGQQAIESLRGKVRDLPIDELRSQFQTNLPPLIDDFFTGERPEAETVVRNMKLQRVTDGR